MYYLNTAEIEEKMAWIREAPADRGSVEMIVARTAVDEREILLDGELTVAGGLVGDNWLTRGSTSTPDGSAHPEAQLTLMNSRYLETIAGSRERWPLAGDQLIVDMDLSVENLAAGQRLQAGTAVLEVTTMPHNGCKKFSDRFGVDAVVFANNEEGKALRLRGLYVKVVQAGRVQTGAVLRKI